MKKRAGRKMRKAAVRMIAGMILCGMALGTAGCGKGKELTSQYRKVKDYSNISVTDDFRHSYADFSLELLRESRKETGRNPMISPLSVMVALEMTRGGASGETKKEMERTLYGEGMLDEMSDERSKQLMAYLQRLPNQKKARFHFANSIWFRNSDESFQMDEDFLEKSAEDYGAQVFAAPFDESTRKEINGWVKKETEGMIPDILKEIPEDAILYLINAMAFEAEWQKTYTKNQVFDSEFFPEEGKPQTVEMMYSTEGYLIRDESARGFIKPYAEGYAFAALMPEEGVSLDAYLAGLSGEDFVALIENAEETAVETGLPKFSSGTNLTLKQILEAMGMTLAFDVAQADFTKMGKYANGNIYIGQVIHSTFVQVDEMGTRAGAATVVEMSAGGVMMPEQVILDHPFLYAIVDTESKLPIFLGIMENADGR